MHVFRWGVLYLGVHFLLYVLVLRHTRVFLREKVIFLYHAFSALAVTCLLLGATAIAPQWGGLVSAIAVISLHGIYSLSFLELWSLAEGSYSLRILDHVDAVRESGAEVDLAQLQRIGASKKESRIESLQRLRLVRRRGDRFVLTPVGRLIATGLYFIALAENLKMSC